MDSESHGREEETDSDAGDEHEEDPAWDGGGGGEEVEEAGAEGGEGVAKPDGPAVVGSFSGDETDEHGAGDDGEGLGESGEAGVEGGEVLGAFEEERHVVEDSPEDDAVDEGEEVGDACGGVGEDAEGEESRGCEEGFPEEEEGEAEDAEDQGEESSPGGPGEHDAAPSDGEEEGGGGGDEDEGAEVVDLREFFAEGARDVVEFEEGNDGGEADGYDGEVEVEDPAPGAARGEGAADDRAGDTADGPDDADAGEVVAAFAEGDHVCDDDFGDGDDASAAGTLDGTTYEHGGEVFGGGADDGADGEEGDGEEEEGSTAPQVGEGDEVGLPDHGGE